jgi:hypothetical protein
MHLFVALPAKRSDVPQLHVVSVLRIENMVYIYITQSLANETFLAVMGQSLRSEIKPKIGT